MDCTLSWRLCLIHRKWLTHAVGSWKLTFRKESTIMLMWLSKNPIQFIVWFTDHNCSLINIFLQSFRFSRHPFPNLNIANNGSRVGKLKYYSRWRQWKTTRILLIRLLVRKLNVWVQIFAWSIFTFLFH